MAHQAIEIAKKEGVAKLSEGIYLQSADNLISDQKNWECSCDYGEDFDGDCVCNKSTDYNASPFYVITQDGCDPTGINDAEELYNNIEGI